MSKKISQFLTKDELENADYIPIIDSSDSNPETQNKRTYFGDMKEFLMKDVNAAEAERVQAENGRVQAENSRVQAETARESQETGYVNQSKSWAVGTNGVARAGDQTDNSQYYSQQSAASATQAYNYMEQARQYAGLVIPTFTLDLDTMILYQNDAAQGITFTLTADKILQYEITI